VEGGFLKSDAILLARNTGSGKTILSSQFIHEGAAKYGEKIENCSFLYELKNFWEIQ
jgi:KaiC/GvpD/RAD55 family RecA-like ATPase